MLTYAQEKGGQRLHLAYSYNGYTSQPICGRRVENYRMTINMPLGSACKNCQKITVGTAKKKEKEFLASVLG